MCRIENHHGKKKYYKSDDLFDFIVTRINTSQLTCIICSKKQENNIEELRQQGAVFSKKAGQPSEQNN
ncbi:hypothetical protein [Echinicola sediminis]